MLKRALRIEKTKQQKEETAESSFLQNRISDGSARTSGAMGKKQQPSPTERSALLTHGNTRENALEDVPPARSSPSCSPRQRGGWVQAISRSFGPLGLRARITVGVVVVAAIFCVLFVYVLLAVLHGAAPPVLGATGANEVLASFWCDGMVWLRFGTNVCCCCAVCGGYGGGYGRTCAYAVRRDSDRWWTRWLGDLEASLG